MVIILNQKALTGAGWGPFGPVWSYIGGLNLT